MRLDILVCSDNQQLVGSLSSIVDRDGYRFKVCCRGMEVLQALKALKFDMLILDLETSGLDGLLLLSIARRIDPKLPIVAISSRPALHEREIQHKGVLYHPVEPTSNNGMEQVVKAGVEYAKKAGMGSGGGF